MPEHKNVVRLYDRDVHENKTKKGKRNARNTERSSEMKNEKSIMKLFCTQWTFQLLHRWTERLEWIAAKVLRFNNAFVGCHFFFSSVQSLFRQTLVCCIVEMMTILIKFHYTAWTLFQTRFSSSFFFLLCRVCRFQCAYTQLFPKDDVNLIGIFCRLKFRCETIENILHSIIMMIIFFLLWQVFTNSVVLIFRKIRLCAKHEGFNRISIPDVKKPIWLKVI